MVLEPSNIAQKKTAKPTDIGRHGCLHATKKYKHNKQTYLRLNRYFLSNIQKWRFGSRISDELNPIFNEKDLGQPVRQIGPIFGFF